MRETTREQLFRRMVIGLAAGETNVEALRRVAELAAALGLELRGCFIEEELAHTTAALGFVRETETAVRRSRPLEAERLAREFGLAAASKRKLLAEVAALRRIAWSFDIVRGEVEAALSAATEPADILVICEPASPLDRLSNTLATMRRVALASTAPVLYLPGALAGAEGPVIVVWAPDGEGAGPVAIAARIASAADAELLVVTPRDGKVQARALEEAAAHIDPAAVSFLDFDPARGETPAEVLAELLGRLIIVERGAFGLENDEAISRLGAERRVPLLVLEPAADAA